MTAALRLYGEFTRITFLKMLAYRLRYYTGIVTYLVFVAGNTFLFRAIYAGLPAGASRRSPSWPGFRRVPLAAQHCPRQPWFMPKRTILFRRTTPSP